jgi:hypothetical protein
MKSGIFQCHSGVKTPQEMKDNLTNPRHRTHTPSSPPEGGEEIFHHPFQRKLLLKILEPIGDKTSLNILFARTQEIFNQTSLPKELEPLKPQTHEVSMLEGADFGNQ